MENQQTTRAVERALDILECFRDTVELSLYEISQKTNLSASTVLRMLNAFQKKNYIDKDPKTKKYRLGSEFQKFITQSKNAYGKLKLTARPVMEDLYNKYNENVQLFVADGSFNICIQLMESTKDFRQIIHIGDRYSLGQDCTGKVLLAYMPEETRNSLSLNLSIEGDVFRRIFSDGYSLSVDSHESSVVGIAAPVFSDSGVVAALSLSGPSTRFINEELTDKIRDTIQAAKMLSERLLA